MASRDRPTLPTVPERERLVLPEPTDPDAAWLVVIQGRDLGRRIDLAAEGTTIGRASGCTVLIDEASISRAHAGFRQRESGWVVRDLGGRNGTLVNDVRIAAETTLNDGDVIHLGQVVLKFFRGATAESSYFDTIRLLSTTDAITGLANRRQFDVVLTQELRRALRYDRVFSLLLFDIDHFKEINDGVGHAGGDAVLRELGRVLQTSIRSQDSAGRIGGEELAVLAPETGIAGAESLAERLRETIERHSFGFDGQHVRVTVSVGACSWTPALRSADAMLARADALLYRAKHSGRNRVASDATP